MDLCISPITGRALVEVALGGVPVVGYDRDWQAEIIEHNVSGYICKFNDIEALSNFSNLILLNHKSSKSYSRVVSSWDGKLQALPERMARPNNQL